VWFLNEAGQLVRVGDGLVLTPPAGRAKQLLSIARDSSGKMWMASGGKLSTMERGELRSVLRGTNDISDYVQGICASRGCSLWVASGGRIRKWDGEKWIQDLGGAPWTATPLNSFIETRNGSLLAGTASDVFFILFPGTDEKPIQSNRISGFQADWILSLLEDREGNLWVGTGGNGLVSLRPNNIQALASPDRWRGRAVLSVFPSAKDGLWVGTDGAGLYRYANGTWENYGHTNGLWNSYVWSIAENPQGDLFVGTWAAGLYIRDDGRFKYAPGMENQLVRIPALMRSRGGSL
jgi:ligand-binding sensor domain-containing protein